MHLEKFKVFLLTLLQITDLTFAILFPSPYGFSKVSSDLKIKYNVLASKILRPNTIYQVVTSLADDSESCLLKVSISRNGMSVSSNELVLHSSQTDKLMLKIPSGRMNTRSLLKYYFPLEILERITGSNSGKYLLKVEGYILSNQGQKNGLAFEHEFPLQFSREFLSIIISPNRAVYNAENEIKLRILFLTTSLKPYHGNADLFLLDPDGFVIRKWQSVELNVGVLTKAYTLPKYPKVRCICKYDFPHFYSLCFF